MRKLKEIIKGRVVVAVAMVILGLFLGKMIFQNGEKTAKHEHEQETVWTCSMHPQIRKFEPGDCPICGMDLVKVSDIGVENKPDVITLSEPAMKLGEIETEKVRMLKGGKQVLLTGKVEADERRVSTQVAHISGRIERLFVGFTGEEVKIGQKLAAIYSPDLVNAQKELLVAATTKETNPNMYKAVVKKLKLWKLSEQWIEKIEKSGVILENVEIHSEFNGYISEKMLDVGNHVQEGEAIFKISDLSKVWITLDAYENDLSYINKGDKVEFSVNALLGKLHYGKVKHIDPVIDPKTRSAKVRLEFDNSAGDLKPEMFVEAIFSTSLQSGEEMISVPKTAVLWTGKKSIVYVRLPGEGAPSFEYRKVVLGEDLGQRYVVEEGLKEGEEVVVNGVFRVDAAAQLNGKTSMMNSEENSQSVVSESFHVSGNCGMCKNRIEKAVATLDGIYKSDWNVETKIMHVEYDTEQTKLIEIKKKIAGVGHDAGEIKADDSTYEELAGCCLYRK
jgi:Cu(I)/Ag(I) efflux system membrane fusion protein